MRVYQFLLLATLVPGFSAEAQWTVSTREIESSLRLAERQLRKNQHILARTPALMAEVQRSLSLSQAALEGLDLRLVPAFDQLDQHDRLDQLAEPRVVAPEPFQTQDPADSLYRRARQALNAGEYSRAADLFRDLRSRYPRSAYVADSYYYQAYALYKRNSTESFRRASELLAEQEEKYPRAATRGDARSLETRIRGELARRGDSESAEQVIRTAESVAPPQPPQPPQAAQAPHPRLGPDRYGVTTRTMSRPRRSTR